jgi:hypothetical protein
VLARAVALVHGLVFLFLLDLPSSTICVGGDGCRDAVAEREEVALPLAVDSGNEIVFLFLWGLFSPEI